jgi:hypothetical protein
LWANQEIRINMTKNMTQKGLALGAAAALVVAGFSAPASAAGLADTSYVSLAPTTGTEYGMNAATGVTFSISAQEASTLTVGKIKFLVTDASGVIEPTVATTGREETLADDSVITVTVGTDTVSIADAAMAAKLAVGDSFYYTTSLTTDGFSDSAGGGGAETALSPANTLYTVTAVVAGTSFAFVGKDLAGQTDTTGAVNGAAEKLQVVREARHATNGTYVVDSGLSDSGATNKPLVLAADAAGVSRSVTVQAWKDSNSNDVIDSTEYASPVRTVTWTKPSEIVAVTTLAPIVGDTKLSAVITTTPVLNGNQLLVQDKVFVNAAFTRSLSTSAAVYADNTDTSNGQGTTSSVWNDTDKTFTVEVNTDADAATEATTAAGADLTDTWTGLAAPIAGGTITNTLAISTTGVVSVVTSTNTLLVSGDKITMTVDAGDTAIALAAETAATVTVTGDKTFTYKVSETTGLPTTAVAATAASGTTDYVVVTYAGATGLVDRVGAETYTVKATIGGAASGNLVTTGVVAAVSATSTIATAASTTVEGKSFTAAGANTTKVAVGTLSVPVTVTVTDSDGVAVGAGRAVSLALAASGTADTFKVNGKTADTVMTDANGQVSATVTAITGANGAIVQLTATAENIAIADIDLTWATVAYGLIDLNGTGGTLADNSTTNLDIIKLGSYSLNLMVADQWFNVPASGAYRLKVTGEGVSASYVTLVDGKATVSATDTGVFGTSMDADILVEKMSGTTVSSFTTHNFDAALSTAYKVNVGANGTTLYGNTVVASVAVAKKALVEIDKRTSSVATPAYANNLVLNGSVLEKSTNAAKVGAVVTVSGPSNILFEQGNVAKRGSLTFNTTTAGKFELKAYSTTAQTDSVVTFTTADGATGTIKVSFTGTGVGEGTALVVTMPAAVKPASTFQVKATLQDAYGNAVDTASGRLKVTYTGAGIVYGTLPTETDANGAFQFSVLLGSNDTGTVSVTVSYDQNADGDFVDAKDLTTVGTTAITASGMVASEMKVNVGTFKGFVALYAKGYEGQKMSAIVAGKWIVVESLASDFERVVRFTGAGYTITTKIYIDGVMIGDAFTTVTK